MSRPQSAPSSPAKTPRTLRTPGLYIPHVASGSAKAPPARVDYSMLNVSEEAIGTINQIEALRGQQKSSGAQRPGIGSQGGGVWVSQEMWRSIRRQLESKVLEQDALVKDHNKVKSELTTSLTNVEGKAKELSTKVQHLQKVVVDEQQDKNKAVDSLTKDLNDKQQQLEQQQKENNQTTDQLMDMLNERDAVISKADSLAKDLEQTTNALKMEAHRHSLAEGRVHALEKELEYFKSKHQVDVDKIHEVEEKNRELMAQSTEMQMQIEALKEEMLLMRRPDDALRDEIMHLQGDNRRLIHLLERTSEFRRLMEDVADLKHVHYVPLSDCLVEEELIQHHYQPERDREVVLSREAYNWVPTEAFELVQEFLDRLFPRVPVQPFMMLLLQLNKVWRDHEQGKLDALRAKHQEDIQRYKRKIVNREPYHEVVQKGKIAHLKKELATSNKKGAKMDRYRELAKAAGKDSESKVLLEWGLATIEKLSKQVADCMQENRLLKRRVTAVTSYHGLVPENVIRGLDATSTPAPLNPEDFIKDTPLPASEG